MNKVLVLQKAWTKILGPKKNKKGGENARNCQPTCCMLVIVTYSGLRFIINVGKYAIHGACRQWEGVTFRSFFARHVLFLHISPGGLVALSCLPCLNGLTEESNVSGWEMIPVKTLKITKVSIRSSLRIIGLSYRARGLTLHSRVLGSPNHQF